MNSTINIPRTLANRLLTLAQLNPETEICGLISNGADNKFKVYPIDNIATDSHCVFEMDPQQQINAFKNIRDKQQALFAIYHSHPNSTATPSKKDVDDAGYPEALNIIISLSTQGVLDMQGYFYKGDKKDDRIEKVTLVIN